MTKRSLEQEFLSVSSIEGPAQHAKVHGIIAAVTPMKKSKLNTCDYFEGKITDGQQCIRFVGFDKVIQQKFSTSYEKAEPVSLSNCELKRSSHSGDIQIMVKKYTSIDKSAAKFCKSDVDEIKSKLSCKEITLGQLNQLDEFEKVTVNVKAIHVGSKVQVAGNKMKQDVSIGDSTATSKLILWGEDVGTIVEGKSYKLSNMLTRIYHDKHYLSKPKDCTIVELSDIEDVEDLEYEESDLHVLDHAEVIGVPRLNTYHNCIACKSRVVPVESNKKLGQCFKCGMMQRITKCEIEVSGMLTLECRDIVVCLQAFKPMLEAITGGNITEEALLEAPPFKVVYDANNIIVDIHSFEV